MLRELAFVSAAGIVLVVVAIVLEFPFFWALGDHSVIYALVGPFVEEALRCFAAVVVVRQLRHLSIFQAALAFGIVVGGAENVPKLLFATGNWIGLVAPFVAFFMHVVVTLLVFLFVARKSPGNAFALSLPFHVVHNFLVLWVGQTADTDLFVVIYFLAELAVLTVLFAQYRK